MTTCRFLEEQAGDIDDGLQKAPGIVPQVHDQAVDTGIHQGPEFPLGQLVGLGPERAEPQVADVARHRPAVNCRNVHRFDIDRKGPLLVVPFDDDPYHAP